MSEEDIARGEAVLAEMLGPEAAGAIRARWRDLSPDLEQIIVGFVAGTMWARDDLDRRTRSLCTISAIAALGRPNALELNVRLALNNGATPAEIRGAILQVGAYAGMPAAWEAMIIAERVFAALAPRQVTRARAPKR